MTALPTVLVTGAAGFAGSHLLDLLAGDPVCVAGLRKPGVGAATQALYPGVTWLEVDLLDRDATRRAIGELAPAAIYHLAGSPHVGQSWRAAAETLSANAMATHHVLDAVRAEGLRSRVVVPSSAYVYRPADRALTEDDAIEAANPYAISKVATELAVVKAAEEDGVPAVVARAFNHTGPRQDPSFFVPGVARQVAAIEAGRAEPVIRVGNLATRRDLTDVRDTVRAYRALAERGLPGRVYNVCSGRAYWMRDLLDLLVGLARVRVTVEVDAARLRPNDTPLLLGDPSRIRGETGWEAGVPIERTLQDLLDFWRRAA
ncbi:MAG TPA: GDP-mannose 4,6-dehydratase [Vicinamibacterales bacterium]|nr:GDP-mannose 4,6-dehydratase [Vicinamibacterales bacterium]HPW20241.1 GDP-mannose 4,6-dehydratase [Vicinamibacterales bacterium]